MSRVVAIGFSKQDQKKLARYYKAVGATCETIPAIENAIELLPANPPTLVLLEKPSTMEAISGLHVMLEKSAPATPFVVALNAAASENVAESLEIMNRGAFDCLTRPLDKYQVLAASKRAALSRGRTLFGAKVEPKRTPWPMIGFYVVLSFFLARGFFALWNGAPASTLNLASATLSGLQWEDRSLWVGNWFDATVTHYVAHKGLWSKARALESREVFRMQDSQPILVCNTPDALVTVGFDLKFRSHQRVVGLLTLQTAEAPSTNPTGLTWDGEHVWSVDGQTNLIYKHSADLRVLDSMKSLISNPVGLVWDRDRDGFWVLGGAPLRLAFLRHKKSTWVWEGPYRVNDLLPADVSPTGVSVGFGRLWVVSGGVPHMTSVPLGQITGKLDGWK